MNRRNFLKAGGAAALMGGLNIKSTYGYNLSAADIPSHRWDGYDFGPGPKVTDRLNQGSFGIEQDQGWRTIESTSPSDKPVKNFGLGLVAYTLLAPCQ